MHLVHYMKLGRVLGTLRRTVTLLHAHFHEHGNGPGEMTYIVFSLVRNRCTRMMYPSLLLHINEQHADKLLKTWAILCIEQGEGLGLRSIRNGDTTQFNVSLHCSRWLLLTDLSTFEYQNSKDFMYALGHKRGVDTFI